MNQLDRLALFRGHLGPPLIRYSSGYRWGNFSRGQSRALYARSRSSHSGGSPSFCRIWVFSKALESEPFDRALELAREADEFVAGVSSEEPTHSRDASSTAASTTIGEADPGGAHAGAPDAAQHSRTALRAQLSDEDRERLIDRLVAGAKNSELATEFGLSPKQVQGFRMGSTREITSRREQRQQQHSSETVSADEVIRYLRQQDDVVVPQGDEFLVNGRFKLSLPDLIERANKMRGRQGKSHFGGAAPNGAVHIRLANGHSTL